MLLWNFRDKNKAKDTPKAKDKSSPDESRRQASLAPAMHSARGRRSSVNLSPRPPQNPPPARGTVGRAASSVRMVSPVAKEGELLYATDDNGTTYIRQAKINYIIE
jgi:hypothetical protein